MSESLKKGQFKWFWTPFLFLIISWAAIYPSILMGYIFFTKLPINLSELSHVLMILLFFIANYFIVLILALAITGFVIGIIDAIVPPKLGSFPNSVNDPNLWAWRIKNTLRSFSRWLWEMPHIHALRVFYYRINNIKIGKNVRLGKYILEDDFTEIGDGTFLAKNTIISGHLFDPFKFTIYRTKIGKNCIFSNWTGTVGANIGDNSILLGNMYHPTAGFNIFEKEGDAVYHGTPPKKVGLHSHFTPKQVKNLKKMIKHKEKIEFYESTLSLIKFGFGMKIRLALGKVFIVFGGVLFQFLINYLYVLLIINLGFPSGDFILDSIFLIFIPPVFIVSIGFFMAGLAAVTRLLIITHFGMSGLIREGKYRISDPRIKKWKLVYLWKQYSLYLASLTPLAIGSTLMFQTYLCKINKNVQMIKALVDPELLKIEKNTQIAAFAVIRTHYIKDDKIIFKKTEIGENVMIGSLTYIGAGTKIGHNTVIGIGAHLPENSICEPDSLYIGNPARRLPLSVIKNHLK